mmetsp:Transcript_15030/g.30929  ORF Transcript_15030/g.30929 Transcript_15030/m.30929 type:complete len:105 (-) Transcript_15030:281-595(-)
MCTNFNHVHLNGNFLGYERTCDALFANRYYPWAVKRYRQRRVRPRQHRYWYHRWQWNDANASISKTSTMVTSMVKGRLDPVKTQEQSDLHIWSQHNRALTTTIE